MIRLSLFALLLLGVASSLHAQSALRKVPLKRDSVIDGVACAPTGRASAWAYASGQLESCPVSRDTIIAGHGLAAGTWIMLNESGVLAGVWLLKDTELQGHRCRGTGYQGWSVQFFPSGALRSCFLAREETIQNVPCRRGTFLGEVTGGVQVLFWEDGALMLCSAARSIIVDQVRVGKRQRVWLRPDGSLEAIGKERPQAGHY